MSKMNENIDFINFVDETCVIQCSDEIDINNEEKKIPTFHCVAYNGGDMVPGNWGNRIVIELSGIKLAKPTIPMRYNHHADCGVGHANKVYVQDGKLMADGYISRETPYAKDVAESSKKGFPWNISVGGKPLVSEYIEEGAKVTANGKTFKGPIVYIKEFLLGELSFCDLGADSKTSADITAKANESDTDIIAQSQGDSIMSDELDKSLGSQEVLATDLPNKEQEEIKEEIDCACGENKCDEKECKNEMIEDEKENEDNKNEEEENKKEDKKVESKKCAKCESEDNEIKASSIKFDSKNYNRIAAINSVECTGFEELRAQAIEEGWSSSDFITSLKAARHDANIMNYNDIPKGCEKMVDDNKVLEAALVINTLGDSAAEKHYSSDELNRADDIKRKVNCFTDVVAYATGSQFSRSNFNDMGSVEAAFTTSGLTKIFRNVVNKSLLAGYNIVNDDWRKFCSIGRVADFKPAYNYRTGGDFTFKKIDGNDGEIPNAILSEQEYTNKAETYALMYSLTRKMLIDDDLGALTSAPQKLGQGAAETINRAVYTALLTNGTQADGNAFFSAAHNNIFEATSEADANLTIKNLATLSTLFETQTTDEGIPIAQEAKYLVVPTALKMRAWNIMNSLTVNEETGVNDPAGVANPFAGQYEVIATPYLQSALISGNSNANWYLFGNPAIVSAIDVVFLNGNDKPTIEQSDVVFDRLGIQFRGYFDFGVALQDYRGAVFAKN